MYYIDDHYMSCRQLSYNVAIGNCHNDLNFPHAGSRFNPMPQSPLSQSVFLTHVGSQMPSRWREFGILLDIPLSELDTLPAHSCVECFVRVIDSWERRGRPEFTWETVIRVLESPPLEEMMLAQKVRKMKRETTQTTLC